MTCDVAVVLRDPSYLPACEQPMHRVSRRELRQTARAQAYVAAVLAGEFAEERTHAFLQHVAGYCSEEE